MNVSRKSIFAGTLTASIVSGILTPQAGALGAGDRNVKDETGGYTVKCQVHQNATGNPVVGLVFGNDDKSGNAAEAQANDFVSLFGPNHSKRHCYTQTKFTPAGAYKPDGSSL